MPATAEQNQKIKEIITDDPNSWDEAWKAKVTPWDAGETQPPLKEAIGALSLPDKGRALVPGCGSGYDVLYIANTLGWEVTGLDISETANEQAKKNLLSNSNLPHADKVKFEVGNFFSLTVPDDKKLDLIYDYTFFVAIPPTLHPDWAKQMANLIAPGGYLITLVFPIDPPTDKGPPFFVRPERHAELLSQDFEKVLDKDPDVSLPHHVGRERLVAWKRLVLR